MRKEIEEAIKELYHILDIIRLNYEDLNIPSDLDLPKGFKVPKFNTISGDGNPLVYLRVYCDQLRGVRKNEALLV